MREQSSGRAPALGRRHAESSQGGGTARIEAPPRAGKLTARERVEWLLDPGSFVEIGALLTHRCTDFGMASRRVAGDGVICGSGTVAGRRIYVFSQDVTVFAGTLSETQAAKICQIMDLAITNGTPVVGLHESAGARLQEGSRALAGCGEIFLRNTLASGVIPQISAIMGPCADVAVFSAAVADFIFMVEAKSAMVVHGPETHPEVVPEEISDEQPGSAHCLYEKSGVAHFLLPNDAACLKAIRDLLSYLPGCQLEDPPLGASDDPANREVPALDQLVPRNPKKPYDVRQQIHAVVDDGKFLEVQSAHARNLVIGFARLANQPVGIVANQPAFLAGVLDIDAALKGARFVRFCDAFSIPLITLVDVPGFLPGIRQEFGGIIKHGAKFIYAFAEATVPKVTVINRKAYGGGYAVMSSKHLRGDVNFAYPTAEIAVMGPEGAVNILYRRELDALREQAELAARRAECIAEYRKRFANPYDAAERGFIDAVIEPRKTRCHLIAALRQLSGKRPSARPKKHGNIPL